MQLFVDHPTWVNFFIAIQDNHGPLQRWLAVPAVELGMGGVTAVRIVSSLAFAATIAAAAALAGRLGRPPAIVAAAAAAVLPAFVVSGSVGIVESLVTATIAWAVVCMVRMAERPSAGAGALAGLFLGLSLLAKKTGLEALALLPFTLPVFLSAWPGPERPWRRWLTACLAALLVLAAAGAVLLAAPARVRARQGPEAHLQYRSVGWVLRHLPSQISANVPDALGAIVGYLRWPLVALAVFGFVRLVRARPDLAILFAAWIVLPVAAVLGSFSAYPRYLLPAYVPIVVCIAFGGVEMVRLAGARSAWRRIAVAAAALAFVPALVFDARVIGSPSGPHYPELDDFQYVSGFPAGTAWPAVARALTATAANGGRRVVTVAHGGVDVGPIGLAAQIGHVSLDPADPNGNNFWARGVDGTHYRFVRYSSGIPADFVVAQEVQARLPPQSLLSHSAAVTAVRRPHAGSSVLLLQAVH